MILVLAGTDRCITRFRQGPLLHPSTLLVRPVCSIQSESVCVTKSLVYVWPVIGCDHIHLQLCSLVHLHSLAQQLNQQEETQPYIKKPLNAFMLFRKEQRPIVMAEHNIRDSATVNAIVGQKVRAVCVIGCVHTPWQYI